MTEHFLKKYVEGEPGFKAEVWYNKIGDSLEYQSMNEATVAYPINKDLTILRSAITNTIIGFKIHNVKEIIGKED